MSGETHFQRYLPEPHPEELVPPEEIRRHILCTGKFVDMKGRGAILLIDKSAICRPDLLCIVEGTPRSWHQGCGH